MRFNIVAKRTGKSTKTNKDYFCLVVYDTLCGCVVDCFVKEELFDNFDLYDNVDNYVKFIYDRQVGFYTIRLFA